MKISKKLWFKCLSLLAGFCMTALSLAQNSRLDHLMLQLAQHPDKDTTWANIIAHVAISYREVNKDSMFRYCEILLNEAQQNRDDSQLAQANLLMGMHWMDIYPEKALNYLLPAHDIYLNLGNLEKAVSVNAEIASVYHYVKDYDKQLFYLKKALQDVLELNNKNLEISLLYHISCAYFCLKNYELAEEYSFIAMQESNNNHQYMLPLIKVMQADIEFQKGNYARSINLNQDVLEGIQGQNSSSLEVICCNNIAKCYMELKQYPKAYQMLEKVFRKLDPKKDVDDYYASMQLLVTLDTLRGDFKHAFKIQREIEQLKPYIFSLEQYRNDESKLMRSAMQEMNMELSGLGSVYQQQYSKSAAMNILIVVLIFAIIGGITMVIRLWRSLRTYRQRQNELQNTREAIIEKRDKIKSNYEEMSEKISTLKKTYHRLNQSDVAKTELFKTISHDLQSPLIQLQHNLMDLMLTDVNEQQFRQATGELTNTVGDISLLLENLLQWSKYQSQDIQVKPQYIEIISLIDDALNQQKYAAAEKNIILSNTIEHRLYVYADEEIVKCSLKTILQNTMKLSDANARITIAGDKNEKNGWIRMNYQGHMPLKDTYVQLFQTDGYDSELSELGKAISLGWMLCRTLMKANNGSLQMNNISKDSFDICLFLPLEESVSEKI